MWYQTTLSQCFPFYFNQKVPPDEHRECLHFHASTLLIIITELLIIIRCPPTSTASVYTSTRARGCAGSRGLHSPVSPLGCFPARPSRAAALEAVREAGQEVVREAIHKTRRWTRGWSENS